MAGFDTYKDAFPHAKLTRSQEGVLEVVLQTSGGTLIFNGYTHEEFVELFHQINQDAGNRVVILTGAGEAFIDRIDPEGFDFFSPRGYDKIYREGKKVLSNLLDIPVPVIAALNGPTTVHSEYVLLAERELAQAPHRTHGDHQENAGHDRHAGHSVGIFRRKFGGTLLLSIPTVISALTIQNWLGY